MRTVIVRLLAILVLFGPATRAQQEQPSLGEVARQNMAAKSSQPAKAAKVITDEGIHSGTTRDSAQPQRKFDPDIQEFCNQLKNSKQQAAENDCAALRIDMGSDYDNVITQYWQVQQDICAALLARQPRSESRETQARELHQKWFVFKDREAVAILTAQSAYAAVQAEKTDALKAKGLFSGAPGGLTPNESDDLKYVKEKYEPRVREKEAAVSRAHLRLVRIIADRERFDVCS